MVLAIIHACLPMIVHVDMVPNYFHFSFFPWRRILHAMTQIRYGSDQMCVGAARLGIQDALSYPESHGYTRLALIPKGKKAGILRQG